ncbi:hypothetical protein [Phenylobacterium sp.]|jgi:hypothetical protein|uniref:hypothetical protein n=1 Tax=Phenylobacterium sp. TaxID=1871053 RepID=UPI002F4004D1
MKRLILAGVAGLILTGAGAAAQAADRSPDQCLRPQYLRNHTIGDDHTLYFDYNGTSVFEVTTNKNCAAAVTSSDPIVLKDSTQGMMCKPIDWDLSVRGSHCIVTGVRKLSPAEVAALPKGKRP